MKSAIWISFAILSLASLTASSDPAVELLSPGEGETITSLPLTVSYRIRKPGVRTRVSVNGYVVGTNDKTIEEREGSIEIPFLRNGTHVIRVDVMSRKIPHQVLGPHAEVSINVVTPWLKPPEEPPLAPNRNEKGEEIEVEHIGGHVIMHEPMNFVHADAVLGCELEGWHPRDPSTPPIRVFDAFMFFNELDVLETRLNELNHLVDFFIICEATVTHQGGPKPMYFAENRERFANFSDKIRHLVVDDLPAGKGVDSWVTENFHRNSLLRALFDVGPKDLVIVSDVDELPRPEILQSFLECDGYVTPAFFYSRFFNFRFEYEFAGPWTHGPRLMRGEDMVPLGYITPQELRTMRMRWKHTKLEEAGWHMSFFTDVEGILTKMDAFAHAEFSTPQWKNREKIAEPRAGGMLKNMACEGLPKYVMESDNPRIKAWIPHCS